MVRGAICKQQSAGYAGIIAQRYKLGDVLVDMPRASLCSVNLLRILTGQSIPQSKWTLMNGIR